jgi:acyl-CoA synthetase (NDP forming)
MDLASGATAAQFGCALDAVLADPSVDAVVTIFVPRLAASPVEVLEAVRGACARGGDVPVVPVFLGAEGLAPDPALPVHRSVEEAARSLAHAVGYARHRSAPDDPLPELLGVDADQAAGLIAEGLADGGGWLSRPAVEALLACYGIPRAPSRWASSPRGVREAAAALGGQVAVKASAPGLLHRTQAGAVRLDVTPAGAERGAREMRAALGASGMRVDGWLVQRMAAPGPELLAGAVSDPQFGPLVVVGAGGAAAELMRDVQVRLASVGPRGASDMVRGLRIRQFLEDQRGAEPVDLSAVEDLVVRIGAMAAAHPQLAELECNPVIASASGVAVVDSRARLGPSPDRRPLGALDR